MSEDDKFVEAHIEALAQRMHERVRVASGGKFKWDDPVESGFGVDKDYWRKAAREAREDYWAAEADVVSRQ